MKTDGGKMSEEPVTLDLERLYSATGQAKLADLPRYEQAVLAQVPAGARVVLTGRAPIWLYLRVAHLLHGRANVLSYLSPPAGLHEPLEIFNHDPR
jgi:hypothetical protein